jgi:DNA-binding transcriptional LysR family regulator
LRTLQEEFPTAAINLRITTMQGGEHLVLERVCALAVTIANVPEANPDAMERRWLCEAEMVTACAPSHPLASTPNPIPMDEFGRHIQIVVTDNQPGAEKTQQGVAGKRQWLVNDLGAKRDLLKAGRGWSSFLAKPDRGFAQPLSLPKIILSPACLVTGFWIQAEMFSDSFSGRVQVPTS